MTLLITALIHTVIILGPAVAPTPNVLKDIIKSGNVEGAILVPSMINGLCRDSAGLLTLQSLKYIHHVRVPLGTQTGERLTLHVRLIPSIRVQKLEVIS